MFTPFPSYHFKTHILSFWIEVSNKILLMKASWCTVILWDMYIQHNIAALTSCYHNVRHCITNHLYCLNCWLNIIVPPELKYKWILHDHSKRYMSIYNTCKCRYNHLWYSTCTTDSWERSVRLNDIHVCIRPWNIPTETYGIDILDCCKQYWFPDPRLL